MTGGAAPAQDAVEAGHGPGLQGGQLLRSAGWVR
jgi:hypothetical protein